MPSSYARTHRQDRGFSLVELMVGLVIGMVAVIVVLQVFQLSEGSKRTTMGGDDAQNNGIIALSMLQRDVKQGGYGSSDFAFIGCTVNLPGGRSVPGMAPVTINHASIPAGDANTDTLLVVYGNGSGSPEGDRVVAQPSQTTYALATPGAFRVNDLVLAAPETRPTPCTLRLEPALTVAPQFTVGTGLAGMANGAVFNFGPAPSVLAYAVRGGNLTVCNHMASDCTSAANSNDPTVWVPIGSNIVSLRAQYGRDTSGPPMDGVVDVYDQTTPTTACGWARVSALRLAIVARSGQLEKEVVTGAAPTWAGSAANAIDLSADGAWGRFRYRTYETTVPMRNMAWKGAQAGC
jgi:type IV pilus assembly protein PilW